MLMVSEQRLLGVTAEEFSQLVAMNDGNPTQDPQSFSDIATWIEEHL
jgi:hypothetical protein